MKEIITGERYIKYFEIMLAFHADELSSLEFQRALGRLKLSDAESNKYTQRFKRDTGNPPEHTMTKSELACDFPKPT